MSNDIKRVQIDGVDTAPIAFPPLYADGTGPPPPPEVVTVPMPASLPSDLSSTMSTMETQSDFGNTDSDSDSDTESRPGSSIAPSSPLPSLPSPNLPTESPPQATPGPIPAPMTSGGFEETKSWIRELVKEVLREQAPVREPTPPPPPPELTSDAEDGESLMSHATQAYEEDDPGAYDMDMNGRDSIFTTRFPRLLQEMESYRDKSRAAPPPPMGPEPPPGEMVPFITKRYDMELLPLPEGKMPVDLLLTRDVYTHIRQAMVDVRVPVVYRLDVTRGILNPGPPFLYPSDNLLPSRLIFARVLSLWIDRETRAGFIRLLEEKTFLEEQQRGGWPLFQGMTRGTGPSKGGHPLSKYLPDKVGALLDEVKDEPRPSMSWVQWKFHRDAHPDDFRTHLQFVVQIMDRHMDYRETELCIPLGSVRNPVVAVVSILQKIAGRHSLENLVFDDTVAPPSIWHFMFFQRFMVLDRPLVRKLRVCLDADYPGVGSKLDVGSAYLEEVIPMNLSEQDWVYIGHKCESLFRGMLHKTRLGPVNTKRRALRAETSYAPYAPSVSPSPRSPEVRVPVKTPLRWSSFFRSLLLRR